MRGRGERLDSWKEIASYLGRGVRTVQRWEKEEGLPVRRRQREGLSGNSPNRGQVYAFKRELDAWWQVHPQQGTRSEKKPQRGLLYLLAGLALAVVIGLSWRFTETIADPSLLVLRRLTSDSGLNVDPAVSPDGKWLVYASDRAANGDLDLWIQPMEGGQARQLTSGPADDHQPDFSPDGTWIAYRSEQGAGGIYRIPAGGGSSRLLAELGRNPKISPDGSQIAYWDDGRPGVAKEGLGGMPFAVTVMNAEGGAARRIPKFDVAKSPLWSPDGERLLVLARDDRFRSNWEWWIVDLQNNVVFETGIQKELRDAGFRWSAPFMDTYPTEWVHATDGRDFLFFSAERGDGENIWRLQLDSKSLRAIGGPEQVTSGTDKHVRVAVAGEDSIVFAGIRSRTDLWSVALDRTGEPASDQPERLTDTTDRETSPDVSRDGTKITYQIIRGGRAEVWFHDLESREKRRLWKQGADPSWTGNSVLLAKPRLAPDGQSVVFQMPSERPHQMEYLLASTGRNSAEELCSFNAALTDWSPDGRYITVHHRIEFDVPRQVISVIDLLNCEGRVYVNHPDYSCTNAQFSPDGKWLLAGCGSHFRATPGTKKESVRFFIPVQPGRDVDPKAWTGVEDSPGLVVRPTWGWSGEVLYWISDRDGYSCIYGRRFDQKTWRPTGQPFVVFHSHQARRSLSRVSFPGEIGPAASRDKIVFSMGEVTGNIWVAEPAG